MAFEDIINRILEDTKQKTTAIIAEANAKAGTMLTEAQRRTDELKKELLSRAQQRANEEELRIVTLARLDLRKDLLKKKQDQIDAAFDQAYDYLLHLKDDEYKKFIKSLLLTCIETGDEVVIPPVNGRLVLTRKIVDEINKELKGKKGNVTLSSERRDISGGFIVRRGKQEINYSLDAIIHTLREKLEPQVVRILFEEN